MLHSINISVPNTVAVKVQVLCTVTSKMISYFTVSLVLALNSTCSGLSLEFLIFCILIKHSSSRILLLFIKKCRSKGKKYIFPYLIFFSNRSKKIFRFVPLKGTVARDFWSLVLFMNRPHMGSKFIP
jgi:hypothetical protein